METAPLEGPEIGEEKAPVKAKQPGSFEKNDPRIAKNVKKARAERAEKEKAEREAKAQKERVDVPEARDPVLTAYRAVLQNDAKFDRNGLEKLARRNHDENPREFEKRYRELEAEEQVSVGGSAKLAEDVGEDRARELLTKLLFEFVAEK